MNIQNCPHQTKLTHSNGVKECTTCHRLFVPEKLARLYIGPSYQGHIEIVEDEDENV